MTTPSFPANLSDYALWATTHGLIAPYGECQCQCGQPATIAKLTRRREGLIKGQPVRYIPGHNTAQPRASLDDLVLPPGTRAIPLTQDKFAIVDAADFDWLNQWKWYADEHRRTFYAARNSPSANGKHDTIKIHQLLAGKGADHIDGNGLNNTRANLRLATTSQNGCNRGAQANNKSGYKGVAWHKQRKKWRANIRVGGKQVHLGYFATPEEAALVYNKAAREYFGEFARLNEVEL